MSRFTFARGVRNDLHEIWQYVAANSRNPDAADRAIDRIIDVFSLLARQPLLGEARDDLASGVRAFVTGSYLVLYKPTQAGVRVIQVVHGARNLAAIFRQPRKS